MPTYDMKQPVLVPPKEESPSSPSWEPPSQQLPLPVPKSEAPSFELSNIPAHSPFQPLVASGSGGEDRKPHELKRGHYLDPEEGGELPQVDWRKFGKLQMASPYFNDVKRRMKQMRADQQHGGVRGQHARVMNQLKAVAPDLRRLSVNKAYASLPRVDAMRYAASQIDEGGHEAYAARRLGKDGADRLARLRKLGSGYENLLVDPGLMSPSHFDNFIKHAQGNQPDSVDPFKMRQQFSDKLGKVDVFRGMNLPRTLASQWAKVKEGPVVHSVLPRELARLRQLREAPPQQEAPQQEQDEVQQAQQQKQPKKKAERFIPKDDRKPLGLIRQLVGPERPTLPALDEAFDKPLSDVVLHRVNKVARSDGRKFPSDLPKEQFVQSHLMPPRPVESKLTQSQHEAQQFNRYLSQQTHQRQLFEHRVNSENMTQSVSYDPKIAQGFGASEAYGGGKPTKENGVFNLHLRMSPLDLIKPEDFVPAEQMAKGVKVNGKVIPNSHHLESLLLSPIQRDDITRFEDVPEKQLPEFDVVDGAENEPDEPWVMNPSKEKAAPPPKKLDAKKHREDMQRQRREAMKKAAQKKKEEEQQQKKDGES